MEAIVRRYVEQSHEWLTELECLFSLLSRHFGRVERQRHAWEYLLGLLGTAKRKNGWQLAEAADLASPYCLQHLLDRCPWDADAVRDDLADYIRCELGDANAVLVVDETGFLKKGSHSVGVQRQYSGTAGRIENCQIGVFLAYASCHGRALLDRDLYLGREWIEDAQRRQAGRIPAQVAFHTKPQLAEQMIDRALAAQVPFAWITGDEVYGDNRSLRVWLEQQDLHFVLAVRSNGHVWNETMRQVTVERLAQTILPQHWTMISAGDGAKGPRWYDWARVKLLSWQMPGERWLLVRRSREDRRLAYYVCYAPLNTDLQTLVRVAGMRWMIEACFEAAKQEVGLAQYEVRSWHGWYRHITLAMVAHAYLAAVRASANNLLPAKKNKPTSLMQQWKQQRLHASP